MIDENTNELNLNDAFPVWNKSEQHIWQILKYIHWIFYNFKSSITHGINKAAIDLYVFFCRLICFYYYGF